MHTEKVSSPHIKIVVENGLDLLDVRGDSGLGGALIFKGQVATAVWSDFEGSVGQFLLSAHNQHYREIGSHFYAIAEKEVNQENLKDTALPILKLFSNGIYSVHLEDFDLYSDCHIFENSSQYAISFSGFYPEEICILNTIPNPVIKEETVKAWQLKIRKQIKTCVVLLESPHGVGFFVLDGHHRMKAYLNEFISARAIVIRKLNPREFTEEDLKYFDIKGFFLKSKTIADSFRNK